MDTTTTGTTKCGYIDGGHVRSRRDHGGGGRHGMKRRLYVVVVVGIRGSSSSSSTRMNTRSSIRIRIIMIQRWNRTCRRCSSSSIG